MNESLLPRPEYMKRLMDLRDKDVIKAIVGIRRCGKSTLLRMFREELLSEGIPENRIIHRSFSYRTGPELDRDAARKFIGPIESHSYVMLDEIQMVRDWHLLVLELFEEEDCDLYITGSNSVMFSKNLSTLLSGRSVDIEMFPFSYREFLEYSDETDSDEAVREYMTYGGFPLVAANRGSEDARVSVLDGIYSSVVLKDVVERNSIRNQNSFERVIHFLARSMGNTLSPKSITDYMSSNGCRISYDSVNDYMKFLEESLIFYRVKRYNLKAKAELTVNDKMYLADPGLRIPILGRRDADMGFMMECLVYLELRRRGYSVYVGCIGDLEVDFVAVDRTDRMYVQVCYSMNEASTRERELRPLRKLNDGYRKLVVTMDGSLNSDYDGIKEIGLREFLLG